MLPSEAYLEQTGGENVTIIMPKTKEINLSIYYF